jgi:hypothetical protein
MEPVVGAGGGSEGFDDPVVVRVAGDDLGGGAVVDGEHDAPVCARTVRDQFGRAWPWWWTGRSRRPGGGRGARGRGQVVGRGGGTAGEHDGGSDGEHARLLALRWFGTEIEYGATGRALPLCLATASATPLFGRRAGRMSPGSEGPIR